MIRTAEACALGVVVVAAGCSLTTSFDGLTGGVRDAGASPDATTDGGAPESGADAPSDAGFDAPCVGVGGPPMVRVGAFCIDTTEVTNAQYKEFTDAVARQNPPQPPECAGNATFTPTISWPPTAATNGKPVVGVDWCDALAYCAWAGKRLCGALDGGASTPVDFANPAANAWYFACSRGGAADHPFPYGPQYDPTRCNGADLRPEAGLVPAGSLPDCVGGFAGVFDMSGNVEEWEDSCAPGFGGVTLCRNRGGTFESSAEGLSCATDSQNTRDFASAHTGLRCCSF